MKNLLIVFLLLPFLGFSQYDTGGSSGGIVSDFKNPYEDWSPGDHLVKSSQYFYKQIYITLPLIASGGAIYYDGIKYEKSSSRELGTMIMIIGGLTGFGFEFLKHRQITLAGKKMNRLSANISPSKLGLSFVF